MDQDTLFGEAVGADPTWTVVGLAAHVARVAAQAFPDDLWIQGQIRNLSRSNNGHVYFTLAEPTPSGGEPRAQLSVTLLAPERQAVNQSLTRAAGGQVRMADGVEVRIRGRLRWYAPRGTLQLRMDAIDPAFTLGRLQADRERLLATLTAAGLLERNGMLPLPLVPLRVGIVTSRGTAAAADVVHELEASALAFEIRLVDARTQGPECGPSVAGALTRLARGVADGSHRLDAVLLVRGGGAKTDLAGFDTEIVARAIADMPVPVLTGLGHQIDRSVADEVAHTAHKTPTAAAGALVERVRAYLGRLDQAWSVARHAGAGSADRAEARLDRRTLRVARAGTSALDRAEAGLQRFGQRAAETARRDLDRAGLRLDRRGAGIAMGARHHLALADQRLAAAQARVQAQDPAIALAKGWSITTTASGRLVRTTRDLEPGDELVTRLAHGTVRSTVTHLQEPDP